MQSTQAAMGQRATAEAASDRPVRILYLDDDDVDRQLMRYYLCANPDFESVLTAVATISDARTILLEGDTDVFVVDNRLPGVESFRETLEVLGDAVARTKIVVVSSETASRTFRDLDALPRTPHAIVDKGEIMAAVDRWIFDRL